MMRRLPTGASEALLDIALTVVVIVAILATVSLIWYAFDCISKAELS